MNCGEKITSDVPSVLRARHKLIHGLTSTETIKGFKMQSLCFFFFLPKHEPAGKSCALLPSVGCTEKYNF